MACASHQQAARRLQTGLQDHPNLLEAVLGRFAALNPFSACALASSGLTLCQLMHKSEEEIVALSQGSASISRKSARLFLMQAESGTSFIANQHGDSKLWQQCILLALWTHPNSQHCLRQRRQR